MIIIIINKNDYLFEIDWLSNFKFNKYTSNNNITKQNSLQLGINHHNEEVNGSIYTIVIVDHDGYWIKLFDCNNWIQQVQNARNSIIVS